MCSIIICSHFYIPFSLLIIQAISHLVKYDLMIHVGTKDSCLKGKEYYWVYYFNWRGQSLSIFMRCSIAGTVCRRKTWNSDKPFASGRRQSNLENHVSHICLNCIWLLGENIVIVFYSSSVVSLILQKIFM